MMNSRAAKSLGRPQKEEALKLRDRAWALSLRSGDQSLAALERHFRAASQLKTNELSSTQPFSLTKIAAGKRGLSSSLDIPAVVLHAEAICPGSRDRFASILWAVLSSDDLTEKDVEDHEFAADVMRALETKSVSSAGGISSELLVRLARVPHPDSLGLLLWYLRKATGGPSESLLEQYADKALTSICRRDPAMQEIRIPLVEVVNRWLSRPIAPSSPPQLRLRPGPEPRETVPLVELCRPSKSIESPRLDLVLHGAADR